MEKALTTHEIATLCNVDITTVINWIESGKLVAYKTPGGHRRVKREDFLRFLKTYQLPIPRGLTPPGMKVLIVDDDDDVRDFLQGIVTSKWAGTEVFEAIDGFTAGKLVAERHPSLVLLDLRLPGIDGLRVCRSLRADRRLKDTKIIAMTAYHDADIERQIRDAGADDYLPKPFSAEEVTRRIERLFPPES